MVKLLWRTDAHLSDVTPGSRTDDWTSTILGKLRQTLDLAQDRDVDVLIDGGDLFNIKSPGRNSHALNRRIIELHSEYGIPIYATIGNHDCVYGNYHFLPQQPLGVLFASGVFGRLYDENELILEKDGVKVRLVGIPFHGAHYDLSRFSSIERHDEDHLVCVAHVLASPRNTTKMFEGEDIIPYKVLGDFAPNVFMFGHWHQDQGVVQHSGKLIVNIGSISRGSLAQDNIERKPKVAVLAFDKQKVRVETIELKVAPAEEIFNMDERVRVESRSAVMDELMANMREALIAPKGNTVEDDIRSQTQVPELVRETALYYVEQAS